MQGRRLGPVDEGGERLPWLEPVEDETPQPSGNGRTGRLILVGLLVALLAVAGITAWSWMQAGGATEGHGELIAAPDGDYKVPAPEPGGMQVEGEGDSAFATSEGAEPKARIDLSAVPEEPITETAARGGKAAASAGDADAVVQLGAFSSEAAANAAWKRLVERFAYLAPLTHSIVPVEQEERTLYRLRANGPDAAAACRRLRAAGEDVWC